MLKKTLPEALRLSKLTKKLAKKRARGWVQRGNAARDDKQWAEAAEYFLNSLSINPARPDIWVQLGHMRKEINDIPSSIDAYKQAIAYDEKYEDAYFHLLGILMSSGRKQECLDVYNKCASFEFQSLKYIINDILADDAFMHSAVDMYATIDKPVTNSGSYIANNSYTIVSACYNVQKYIDAFIYSIVNQTADKSCLRLVMVDDGSTDETKDRIHAWMEKYPGLITYLYQKNGGQASARNAGLNFARGNWVTFIDPDDAISAKYFENVDLELSKPSNENVDLVCTSFIFYHENRNEFSDAHPLSKRFKSGTVRLTLNDSKEFIQLSASSAFMRLNVVKHIGLEFDPAVRPSFEDALFVNKYLLHVHDCDVLCISNAHYYYRKREDGTSTLDDSWCRDKFVTLVPNGFVQLAEYAVEKFGRVPRFVANVILYDLSWILRRVLTDGFYPEFLSDEDRSYFIQQLRILLKMIGKEYITEYSVTDLQYIYRVGMSALISHEPLKRQYVYITNYDYAKNEAVIKFYNNSPISECPLQHTDGLEVVSYKSISHDLLGFDFAYEHIYWVSVPTSGDIRALNNGFNEYVINLNGKVYRGMCSVRKIRNSIQNLNNNDEYHARIDYRGAWLFMDRDNRANDNAEHLYRYVRDNRPEIPAYFVISKNSFDWSRLERDGFNLIDYGSSKYYEFLKGADHLISSHADEYTFGGAFGPNFRNRCSYRFTFLQHGVIKDDLSGWLNRKNIDNFIVSAEAERDSILSGKYTYSPDRVSLTGLARYDRLIEKSMVVPKHRIMVMPTWRKDIVGPSIGAGNDRVVNAEFVETQFCQKWGQFLRSDALRKVSEEYGLEICFMPHTNIVPYIDVLDVPDYVKCIDDASVDSFQDEILSAALLVTDYSSVAFDAAYAGSAVLYYQFDWETIQKGAHTYRPGYYSYIDHGFGPVCHDDNELGKGMRDALDGRKSGSFYDERVNSFFAFSDANNCKRTLASIEAMVLK